MTTTSRDELLAAHLAVEHPCCYIISKPDGSGFDRCGQWCGHIGQCTSYVPGQYLLLPPVLSPLEKLRARRAHWNWTPCPVCGQRIQTWDRQVGEFSWQLGPGLSRRHQGALWSLGPCGCEAFEPPDGVWRR